MSRPARSPDHGFTLAEVMISILILAIAVMSVFSIQLAMRAQTKKTVVREAAAGFNRELQEKLKNYVRPSNSADVQQSVGLPGSPAWHLPGDTCNVDPPGTVCDTCTTCPASPDCWALDETCAHDAAGMLPDEFKNPVNGTPPGKAGKITYIVTLETLSNGEPVRKVTSKVAWTERQE